VGVPVQPSAVALANSKMAIIELFNNPLDAADCPDVAALEANSCRLIVAPGLGC
jgi:hypothetical protein